MCYRPSFIEDYLRTDGLLMLRLVRLNLGVHTCLAIVTNLFRRYRKCIREMEDSSIYLPHKPNSANGGQTLPGGIKIQIIGQKVPNDGKKMHKFLCM